MNAYPKAIDALMSLKDTDYRGIVIELCKKNPSEFVRIVDATKGPDPVIAEIVAILQQPNNPSTCSRKIQAIKKFRELTGQGLRESKDFIEKYMYEHHMMNAEDIKWYLEGRNLG